MHKHKSIDFRQVRKSVANLYIGVLTHNITVQEALVNFPKDCEDKTVIAAWHALCHLEADEELRLKDGDYKEEQDAFLEFIENTLRKGEELPINIINSYLPYYSDSLTPHSTKLTGIIGTLKKFLCI